MMKSNGIGTPFHYIPLHSSPAGKKYCRTIGDMKITDKVSDTLVRLPLFYELDERQITSVEAFSKLFFEKA